MSHSKNQSSVMAFRLSRSSSNPPDSTLTIQRASAFGDAVRRLSDSGVDVTLLCVRSETEVATYLVSRGQGAKSTLATTLCSALGAKIDNPDAREAANHLPFDISQSRRMSFLVARPSDVPSFATQSGNNPIEVAHHLAATMQPGSWIGVSLRSPTKTEIKRSRRWYQHRRRGLSPTHYSNDGQALIATYVAGAETDGEVNDILTQSAALSPGFDIESTTYSTQSSWPRWASLPIGLAVAVGSSFAPPLRHLGLLAYVGLGALAGAISFVTSLIPPPGGSTEKSLRTDLSEGLLPTPVKRRGAPRPPVDKMQTGKDGTSRHVVRAGGYPLAAGTFLLSPSMVVGLASPHNGVTATAVDTAYRTVPTALTDDIGPLVAYAESAGPGSDLVGVHLDAAELFGGVSAIGQPGTGKTTLLHNLFAWSILERRSPTGKKGWPGRRNCLIAFESKGEGTTVYSSWADAFGDRLIAVEVAEESSPAIDIVDTNLAPDERAVRFVEAMKYAFDESAIQGLSTETLVAVFTASMTITQYLPDVAAATAHLTRGEPSFVSIAHLLLGGGATFDDAKQISTNVAAAFRESEDGTPRHEALALAVRSLNILFGPDSTAAKWSNATSAARNKVDVLVKVPHWWRASRSRGSWRDILENHLCVVVNSGATSSGATIPSEVGQVIAAMTAYSLKKTIEQQCSRWESQGRYISIFADEVAILTSSSSEVIEWWRAQGRSYGVRTFLAAQWPEQLPDNVRTSFLSATSVFWFQQTNPKVVSEAVARLNVNVDEGSPTRWKSVDIGNLQRFQAVIHATAGGRLQPPVPVFMGYWTDPVQFSIDQGWVR